MPPAVFRGGRALAIPVRAVPFSGPLASHNGARQGAKHFLSIAILQGDFFLSDIVPTGCQARARCCIVCTRTPPEGNCKATSKKKRHFGQHNTLHVITALPSMIHETEFEPPLQEPLPDRCFPQRRLHRAVAFQAHGSNTSPESVKWSPWNVEGRDNCNLALRSGSICGLWKSFCSGASHFSTVVMGLSKGER